MKSLVLQSAFILIEIVQGEKLANFLQLNFFLLSAFLPENFLFRAVSGFYFPEAERTVHKKINSFL
jgi:hypothetical protein